MYEYDFLEISRFECEYEFDYEYDFLETFRFVSEITTGSVTITRYRYEIGLNNITTPIQSSITTQPSSLALYQNIFCFFAVPIAIKEPPKAHVTAHVGTTAQCGCAATGVPDPTITWLYNDLPLMKSERLTVVSKGGRGSLSISNIQKSDEGRYTCEASNNMLQRVTARPDCRVVVKGERLSSLTFD